MKICKNGIIRDMTPEEIAEMKKYTPEEVKETVEERLEKLEKLFTKISDFIGMK
jgi:hypothetical protein